MVEKLYTLRKCGEKEEIHVFEAKWVDVNGKKTCENSNNAPECGDENVTFKGSKSTGIYCKNEQAMREEAAKIGRQVCGNCIKTLYATFN